MYSYLVPTQRRIVSLVSLGKHAWLAFRTKGSLLKHAMKPLGVGILVTGGPAAVYRPVERWRPSSRKHVLRAYFTLGVLSVFSGIFWASLTHFLFL